MKNTKVKIGEVREKCKLIELESSAASDLSELSASTLDEIKSLHVDLDAVGGLLDSVRPKPGKEQS